MIFSNKNNKLLNVFDNIDSDDCKSKINILIVLLLKYVDLINYKPKMVNNKEYKKTLIQNKEAVMLYLRLSLDVLCDHNINEKILDNENLDYICDLKGNLDLKSLKGKKLLLQQIRNSFAHKSGKIIFFIEDGIKKVRFDNKSWFSIKVNVSDINKLFEKIEVLNENNKAQKLISSAISFVDKNEFSKIKGDSSIIILLNLLMCYNKESIFDVFMQTQTSFIDASKFEINSTENLSQFIDKAKKIFFERYNITFHSEKDRLSYNNEWKTLLGDYSSSIFSQLNNTYNIENMPYDTYTCKHIPVPIFLKYLRDANSHGRIKITDDYFIFYNQEKGSNSKPYFFIKIQKQDLVEFLNKDYFVESLITSINEHRSEFSREFYLLEKSESANSIANYIDIYRNRMKGMSEIEVIEYMYKNNKFSSYLMEFPDQVKDFINYRLNDGTLLLSRIISFESMKINEFQKKLDSNYTSEFMSRCLNKGQKLYSNYIENGDDNFFKTLYSFERNLDTFEPNIIISEFNELSKDDSKIIFEGADEMKEEFEEGNAYLDISEESARILVELGMQTSKRREIDKIMLAIGLRKDKRADMNSTVKEKRYTIKNIQKHGSLAHVYLNTSKENLKLFIKKNRTVSIAICVALAVKLLNLGVAICGNKLGFNIFSLPPEILLVSLSSTLALNFSLRFAARTKTKLDNEILKQSKRVEMYSDDDIGGEQLATRNNGSNNIRK